jgi:hypothetical protein
MKAWKGLAATFGALAIIVTAWGASGADQPANNDGSVWDMLPPSVQGIVAGMAIDQAISAVDEAAAAADQAGVTIGSPACKAFSGLTTDAQINATLANIQRQASERERLATAANNAARAAESDEVSMAEQLNNASVGNLAQAHTALENQWRQARKDLAKAQASYKDAVRELAVARAAASHAPACANAARALLAAPSAANAAPSAAPATPVPPSPAQATGLGSFQGSLTFTIASGEQWVGQYTAQPGGPGSIDAKVTWSQAPPNAGEGFQVGQQVEWIFAVQPSGDVSEPTTPFGVMNGHIDPTTRTGSGEFLGPCSASDPPVACNGSWTAAP